MATTKPRVLIVGGGFGGLRAARLLRRKDVNLTVADRRNHHLFQPLLYQVATSTLSATEITYPIRVLFRGQRNAEALLAQITAIDLQGKRAFFRGGELRYDCLILATGAETNYFGHDDWRPFAPGLKSIEDGVEVRRRILLAFEVAERETNPATRAALLTFIVVGGGATGVELAGALIDLATRVMRDDFRNIRPQDARVILIEAGPRVLPEFPEDLSADTERSLASRGVEIMKSSPVTAVLPDGVMTGRNKVLGNTIVWTAGVTASPLAQSLGTQLDRHGRIIVERDLSIPGHPEAFAIGDVASFSHQTGRPLPGVAPVAIQQGECAARNILALESGKAPEEFHYHDKGNLATLGRGDAVAAIGSVHLRGLPAWITWLTVHITYLIGFRNRLAVLTDWAWAYLAGKPTSRLVYCDIEWRPETVRRGGAQ